MSTYRLADGNSLQTGLDVFDRKILENIHRHLHKKGTLKRSGGLERPMSVGTVQLQ